METWSGRRVRTALRRAAAEYTARGWDVVPGAYLVRRWSRPCDRHSDRRDCRLGCRHSPAYHARRSQARRRDGARNGAWIGGGSVGAGPGARLGALACSCARIDCATPGAHPAEPAWQDRVSETAVRGVTDVDAVGLWWSRHPYNILLPTGWAFEAFDVSAQLGAWALRLVHEVGAPTGPICRLPGGRWVFFTAPSGQSFPDLTRAHGVRHRGLGGYVLAPPFRLRAGAGVAGWIRPPGARRLARADSVAQVLADAGAALRTAQTGAARSHPRYRLGVAGLR